MSLAENMVIARPVFLVHESHRTDVKLLFWTDLSGNLLRQPVSLTFDRLSQNNVGYVNGQRLHSLIN